MIFAAEHLRSVGQSTGKGQRPDSINRVKACNLPKFWQSSRLIGHRALILWHRFQSEYECYWLHGSYTFIVLVDDCIANPGQEICCVTLIGKNEMEDRYDLAGKTPSYRKSSGASILDEKKERASI